MKFFKVLTIALFAASALRAQEWVDEKTGKTAEAAPAPAAAEESAAEPTEALPGMDAQAEAVPAPAAKEEMVHTVVKGDCLWNLAGTFYNEPFDWPKIFEANRSLIQDPDLIYPDQRFRIPGKTWNAGRSAPMARKPADMAAPEAVEAAPEAAPVEEAAAEEEPMETAALPEPRSERAESTTFNRPAQAKPENMRSSRAYRAGTFLAEKDWRGTAVIVEDSQRQIMISQGDVIYVNIGSLSGLEPRKRGVVYRKTGAVYAPDTGDTVGHSVKRLGVIEIAEEVSEKTASAVVVTSIEPMRVGDHIVFEQ